MTHLRASRERLRSASRRSSFAFLAEGSLSMCIKCVEVLLCGAWRLDNQCNVIALLGRSEAGEPNGRQPGGRLEGVI